MSPCHLAPTSRGILQKHHAQKIVPPSISAMPGRILPFYLHSRIYPRKMPVSSTLRRPYQLNSTPLRSNGCQYSYALIFYTYQSAYLALCDQIILNSAPERLIQSPNGRREGREGEETERSLTWLPGARSSRAKSAAAVEVTAMGARACLFCEPRFASPRQDDSRNAATREKEGTPEIYFIY